MVVKNNFSPVAAEVEDDSRSLPSAATSELLRGVSVNQSGDFDWPARKPPTPSRVPLPTPASQYGDPREEPFGAHRLPRRLLDGKRRRQHHLVLHPSDLPPHFNFPGRYLYGPLIEYAALLHTNNLQGSCALPSASAAVHVQIS